MTCVRCCLFQRMQALGSVHHMNIIVGSTSQFWMACTYARDLNCIRKWEGVEQYLTGGFLARRRQTRHVNTNGRRSRHRPLEEMRGPGSVFRIRRRLEKRVARLSDRRSGTCATNLASEVRRASNMHSVGAGVAWASSLLGAIDAIGSSSDPRQAAFFGGENPQTLVDLIFRQILTFNTISTSITQ